MKLLFSGMFLKFRCHLVKDKNSQLKLSFLRYFAFHVNFYQCFEILLKVALTQAIALDMLLLLLSPGIVLLLESKLSPRFLFISLSLFLSYSLCVCECVCVIASSLLVSLSVLFCLSLCVCVSLSLCACVFGWVSVSFHILSLSSSSLSILLSFICPHLPSLSSSPLSVSLSPLCIPLLSLPFSPLSPSLDIVRLRSICKSWSIQHTAKWLD